jgi:hypothetical protein
VTSLSNYKFRLDDLAVVIDLLLTGKQGDAFEVSAESREEFDNGKK